MIRCIFIVALVSAACATAVADPSDSLARPSRYFFSVRSAALLCSECDIDGNSVGLLSTVHGINLNKTFGVGVGAGLTSVRSTWLVPVFGNIRMNMYGKKKNKLFLELNYGAALTYSTDNIEYGTMRTTCKSYFQPAVGYSIAYHDLRIAVLLGVQALKLVSHYEYPGYNGGWGGFYGQGSPNTTDHKYDVSRFMIGISVGWRD